MNDVKICGERGPVTFCPKCKDWEPFRLLRTQQDDVIYTPPLPPYEGAECCSCQSRLPKVEQYKKEAAREA